MQKRNVCRVVWLVGFFYAIPFPSNFIWRNRFGSLYFSVLKLNIHIYKQDFYSIECNISVFPTHKHHKGFIPEPVDSIPVYLIHFYEL